MGCFYCDEHHEGREAIMFKVGEMKAGVLYLFKDQAHKGRCALALEALARLGEERQILLFTCHSREARLAEGREGAAVLRLQS